MKLIKGVKIIENGHVIAFEANIDYDFTAEQLAHWAIQEALSVEEVVEEVAEEIKINKRRK